MPQVLKAEVESRILDAAIAVFASDGYAGATMASIARRAELSTGNLYRYFKNKEALFEGALDPDFAARFATLLSERVAALARLDSVSQLDAEATHTQDSLLDFWVANRLRVVVLLDRAEGTRYADFGQRFVQRLVDLALSAFEQASPRDALPPLTAFTLHNIFDAARRSIVSILETHESEADIRRAFAAFWSFQLAGLAGFQTWVLS